MGEGGKKVQCNNWVYFEEPLVLTLFVNVMERPIVELERLGGSLERRPLKCRMEGVKEGSMAGPLASTKASFNLVLA